MDDEFNNQQNTNNNSGDGRPIDSGSTNGYNGYGSYGNDSQSGQNGQLSQSGEEGQNGQNSQAGQNGDYGNGYGNNGYSGSGYSNYGGSNNNGYSGGYGTNSGEGGNGQNAQSGQPNDNPYDQYGGNMQYKWNYDDYQKALGDNKEPKKKKNRGFKPFIITVSSVLAVAVIGLAVFGAMNLAQGNGIGGTSSSAGTGNSGGGPSMNIVNQPTTSSSSTAATGKEMTVEQLASKLTPAVVGVEIYDLTSQSVEPTAEGTGIVMSSDGYIVTNQHVVDGAQKIRVVLSNGKVYDTVKLVGQDTKTDVAVLKINATGLTTATFGNSDQLKVGQSVIAIGNPDGLTLQSTVTDGIISGLNRDLDSANSGTEMSYIQTNALINPGNSGGPLVNMYGQVVGINDMKITETGFEGLGFAIPINTVQPVVDSIIKNGYVTGRVKVGISVYSLSSSQAAWYSYPSGLYVESIEQDSDAYAKGLREKDIITAINGVNLANDDPDTVYNTFYKEESKYKAGQTVTLKVYRPDSGNTMTFNVKLEEDKGDTDSSSTDSSADPSQQQSGDQGQSGYSNGSGSGSSDNGGSDFSDFFNQFGQ